MEDLRKFGMFRLYGNGVVGASEGCHGIGEQVSHGQGDKCIKQKAPAVAGAFNLFELKVYLVWVDLG